MFQASHFLREDLETRQRFRDRPVGRP